MQRMILLWKGIKLFLKDLVGDFYTIEPNNKISDNLKYLLATIQVAQNQIQTKSWGLAKLLKLKIVAEVMLAFNIGRITKPPTTDRPPNNPLVDRPSTDPPITDSTTTDSPVYRPYNNWPPTLWLTKHILTESQLDQFFPLINFNWSIRLFIIYYWLRAFIYKMTGKKERW